MIQIKRIIAPDYETSGNLYTIEVTTDSSRESEEALIALLELQEKQKYYYKPKKETSNNE